MKRFSASRHEQQSTTPWLHGQRSRLSSVVVFALQTGMRMGEIIELSWRGVDLARRTVTIFRSKNGERRTIPVNDTVLQIPQEKTKIRSLETDRVFCSKIFTPMESGHLRRAFRLALGKARIEDFHFHDLRHTFATAPRSSRRRHLQGAALARTQISHQDPGSAHHYPESLRDGVETLDRVARSSTNLAQSPGMNPSGETVWR